MTPEEKQKILEWVKHYTQFQNGMTVMPYSEFETFINAMPEESEFCRWQTRDIKDLQDCIARLVESRKTDEEIIIRVIKEFGKEKLETLQTPKTSLSLYGLVVSLGEILDWLKEERSE